jgi:hypothetical protein
MCWTNPKIVLRNYKKHRSAELKVTPDSEYEQTRNQTKKHLFYIKIKTRVKAQ